MDNIGQKTYIFAFATFLWMADAFTQLSNQTWGLGIFNIQT